MSSPRRRSRRETSRWQHLRPPRRRRLRRLTHRGGAGCWGAAEESCPGLVTLD